MEARHHGADGAIQNPGDLLVCQPLHFPEEDDRPVVFRKSRDRPGEALPEFPVPRHFLGGLRVYHRFGLRRLTGNPRVVEGNRGRPRRLPPPVDRLVDQETVEPGIKIRPEPEVLQFVIRLHEGVLHHVLGIVRISHDPQGHPVGTPLVPFHQIAERPLVAVLRAPYEILVREVRLTVPSHRTWLPRDLFIPRSRNSRSTRIMAILMMSAALPWIGVLIAILSAASRRTLFWELMSLRNLRLPRMVWTVPSFLACSLSSSMYR